MSYDRYKKFKKNGSVTLSPAFRIQPKSTDFFEKYSRRGNRLDIISNNYYNDPNYDWLIMSANPEYGSLEYEIPEGTILRIPYPLETSLEQYENNIDEYLELYGYKNV